MRGHVCVRAYSQSVVLGWRTTQGMAVLEGHEGHGEGLTHGVPRLQPLGAEQAGPADETSA